MRMSVNCRSRDDTRMESHPERRECKGRNLSTNCGLRYIQRQKLYLLRTYTSVKYLSPWQVKANRYNTDNSFFCTTTSSLFFFTKRLTQVGCYYLRLHSGFLSTASDNLLDHKPINNPITTISRKNKDLSASVEATSRPTPSWLIPPTRARDVRGNFLDPVIKHNTAQTG